MYMIRPTTITDSILTSSNVPDVNDIGTSATSLLIEIASKTFTTQTGLPFQTGEWVKVYSAAGAANYMYGKITSYSGTSLVVDVSVIGGSGTKTDWKISYGWDASAIYPAGDQVQIRDTDLHMIYEALSYTGYEVMTLDVAPSAEWEADTTITGQTSSKTCVVVAKLTTYTYLVKDRTGDFTLGEIVGVTGWATQLADQGAAKPSFAAATNTGYYPPDDVELDTPLFWKKVAATNRHKAFDDVVGTQTENAGSITYGLTPGIVTGLAFDKLEGTSVTVTMTDPTEGEVYDETFDLISTVGIYDYYEYFFEDVVLKTSLEVLDLPPYALATLDITIPYTGGTAKVGNIAIGKLFDVGTALFDLSFSGADWSQIEVDDTTGYRTIKKGNYSDTMKVIVRIQNDRLDEVKRLIVYYRGTLIAWIGIENYSCALIFGYPVDRDILFKNDRYSECSIEIAGVISDLGD